MLKLRNVIRVRLNQSRLSYLLTRQARSFVVVFVSLPLLTVVAGYGSLYLANAILSRVNARLVYVNAVLEGVAATQAEEDHSDHVHLRLVRDS